MLQKKLRLNLKSRQLNKDNTNASKVPFEYLYDVWVNEVEAKDLSINNFSYTPCISVILAVNDTYKEKISASIKSLCAQNYTNWELIIVYNFSDKQIRKYKAKRETEKIKYIKIENTDNLANFYNEAFAKCSGEFILCLQSGDILSENALSMVAQKLNEDNSCDIIYSDEDQMDISCEKRKNPFFKPDWSPDTLLSFFYFGSMCVYRKQIVQQVGGLSVEFDKYALYDLALRVTEISDKIKHIPMILLHSMNDYFFLAKDNDKQYKLKSNMIDRRHLDAELESVDEMHNFRINYLPAKKPLVSIIIPSKDNYMVLKRCIESMVKTTDYKNYEIILVDNGSDEENKEKYTQLAREYSIRYIYEQMSFNFSKMCNIGADIANGQYYLFLNDDIEIISGNWLERMLGQAVQFHTGAVGAKLLYPNTKLIQHTGVICLTEVGPAHAFGRESDEKDHYFGRNLIEYDYLAVTGACLMVDAEKYKKVNGFNEELSIAYNDIDICLKLYEAGYYNVVRSDAVLYHHESISRGYDLADENKKKRLANERELLNQLHPMLLKKDPFYNINLTQEDTGFSYNLAGMDMECTIKEIKNQVPIADNIVGVLDEVNVGDKVSISGWAFINGYADNNNIDKKIILQQKDRQYLIDTYKVYRSDLSSAFPKESNIDLAGFHCEFSKDRIESGNYDISIQCGNSRICTNVKLDCSEKHEKERLYYMEKYKDVINQKSDYEFWIDDYEKKEEYNEIFSYNPKISVIVPVYNVLDRHLVPCIESVLNQVYQNWELCIADDCSTWENVKQTLQNYETNPKVKIVYRNQNGHISKCTNSALEVATGEFVGFLDCDDLLAPNALYEVVKQLNSNKDLDFIYSDEDKIDDKGEHRKDPFFKPDWSPDTFMSCMYTCHFAVYRRSLVDQIGGIRPGFEGAQDYDFTLRFTEKTKNIYHIPKILYHWRTREGSTSSGVDIKPYALKATKKSKEEAIFRRKQKGELELVDILNQYRVNYVSQDEPYISIIIPTRNHYESLKKCIYSLFKLTSYVNYEVVIIDNNSSSTVREENKSLAERFCCKYVYLDEYTDFSKLYNEGSKMTEGNYLLFLDDSLRVIQSGWLTRIIAHAEQEHVGAVGVKILSEEGKIMHLGIANLNTKPAYCYHMCEDNAIFDYGRNRIDFNYLAVSSSCLLIAKDKFNDVGGFNENLSQQYADLDLGIKLVEAGNYNVVKSDIVLMISKTEEANSIFMKPFESEQELSVIYSLHPAFKGIDPFYNYHLCQKKADYSFIYDGGHRKYSDVKSDKSDGVVSSDVVAAIDSITVDDDIISIVGWAFIRGVLDNNDSVVRLSLNNSEHSYMISTEKVYRPDLANVFTEESLLDFTGFKTYIKKSDICCGNYTISVECNSKIANTNWDITV